MVGCHFMAEWKIETSKRPSRCLACWHPIRAGEFRFGTSVKTRWFHLGCADEGAPQVFPPFAKQAAALMKKVAPPQLGAIGKEKLAAMREIPGDVSLEVLTDLLLENGDPWGELISLRVRGEEELAIEHLLRHRESLYGKLKRSEVQWRDGLIVSAELTGPDRRLPGKLEQLAQTRTASRLTSLTIEGVVNAALLDQVSRTVGPTLERLTLVGPATGFEALACPRLESLRLSVPFGASLRLRPGPAPALEGLLQAKLPALKVLRLTTHRPLSLPFLEALLDSKLLTRLEQLDLEDESNLMRTLDDAGLRLLLARKRSLGHVKAMWVERAGRALLKSELAAANTFFEARGQRALKRNRAEDHEVFDEV